MPQTYKKIGPSHPMYGTVTGLIKLGVWVCDAATHNSAKGCTNPLCFKKRKPKVKN